MLLHHKRAIPATKRKELVLSNKTIYICVFGCFSLLLEDIKESDYQFFQVTCWLIHLFKSCYLCALLLFKPGITDSTSFKCERLMIQGIRTVNKGLITAGKKSKWATLTRKKI